MQKQLASNGESGPPCGVPARSRANALLSVRRVTEVNAGRKTAGVDGRIVLGGREKAEMASWLQHGAQGFVKVACAVYPGERAVRSRIWSARRGCWAMRRVSAV